jgi:hypothetical protein
MRADTSVAAKRGRKPQRSRSKNHRCHQRREVAELEPDVDPFVLPLFAALAEKERALISTRTRQALSAAKARGVSLGNPRLHEARKNAVGVVKAEADRYAANVLPIIREAQKAGANTLRRIAEALNARGIPTARGGQWHAQSVGLRCLNAFSSLNLITRRDGSGSLCKRAAIRGRDLQAHWRMPSCGIRAPQPLQIRLPRAASTGCSRRPR